MGFTPEELAEMARADAEIEASFRFTGEEVAMSRFLDRAAALEAMDARSRARAEAQRRYYEANREKLSEGKLAIRNLRTSLRLSQKDFAALLGVSRPTISHWEHISAPENWEEIVAQYAAVLRTQ